MAGNWFGIGFLSELTLIYAASCSVNVARILVACNNGKQNEKYTKKYFHEL